MDRPAAKKGEEKGMSMVCHQLDEMTSQLNLFCL